MATCGRICANWRSNVVGSAIDGCTSLLCRVDLTITRKNVQRLHREEARRWRPGAVHGAGATQPVLEPGFVHDQMATARRFRILNIADDVTGECLQARLNT